MSDDNKDDKLARGIEEQAAIELVIRAHDAGLDTEIAGEFMKGVADGKSKQVLDRLGMNWPKLVKEKKK